jgi:hypothetical protein
MRMMEVPNLSKRIDLQLWIHEFPLSFAEVSPAVTTALNAVREPVT